MTNSVTPLVGFLEEKRSGREQGVLLTSLVSLVAAVLSLPFIPWLTVPDPGALYGALGIAEEAAQLGGSYSVFSVLRFVELSGVGALSTFSMALVLLGGVSFVLHVLAVVRVLLRRYGEKGLLSYYTLAQTAMLMSMFTCVGVMAYVPFANGAFEMHGFSASAVPVVTMVLALAGYVVVKMMERRERVRQKEHGFIKEFKINWILFLFLLPAFIYFMINNYLPMLGVYLAFTQFNFRDGLYASPYVGLANFEYLFKSDLLRLTRNTVLYNAAFILLGNALQIFFAILVSRVNGKWFKKISQTLIFMPYFVSFVILKVLVYNLLEYDLGMINSIIISLGGERLDFYNQPSYWPYLITFFYIWKNLGYGMVVYLATIMGINDEYYDAAKVDGANIFQQIRYITLPHLKPTFIILFLYALGSIMKGQFELFYQMIGNNGMLFNITDIIDTYVYRIATTQPTFLGQGAAAGLYQSVFGFVIIVITNFIIKRKNEEFALF